MGHYPTPPDWVLQALREGQVIPAHPLALTLEGGFDEHRQRALTRYYHAAGAGGIAIGVHTTQFEIRSFNLYEPVLKCAASVIDECDRLTGRKTVRIAGICGATEQAVREATRAVNLDYHAGLLSLSALKGASSIDIIEHCRKVAERIPLFGFYLQPAVGGIFLSSDFWHRFAEIPNVIAIKIAPFNRYHTLDVMRAVAETGRENEIALYTGNDDHIVLDLLTMYSFETEAGVKKVGMVGGLLGHWACWTHSAVELLNTCKQVRKTASIPATLITLAEQITDCNAAFFDVKNQFAGCIPGIHEVLRRQGLLDNVRCLNPEEKLSPGQSGDIDRVYRSYPHLNDDAFVTRHLADWLDG